MKFLFLSFLSLASSLAAASQISPLSPHALARSLRQEHFVPRKSANGFASPRISPRSAVVSARNRGGLDSATPAASEPAGIQQQQPAAAATSTPLAPADVQSLLQRVYMAAFRVNDLLTLLDPQKWKIDDAERQSFNQTLGSLRQQLKDLEPWRSQLAAQPQNVEWGDKLAAALDGVRSGVDVVSRAVGQYDNPAKANDYTQSAADLGALRQKIDSYLASLRASPAPSVTTPVANPAVATGPSTSRPSNPGPASAEPQTERIEAPSAAPPPATTVETPESMKVYQAKVLLHKIYVATFRLNDLLGVVHPDRWKTPQPLRDAFNQRIGILRKHLSLLDERRIQFDDRPQDAYAGFQTYTAITPVIGDIEAVSREVMQFEGASTGSDFRQPAQWLAETQHDLRPYLEFILQNREQAIHGYQADLAACQNTLNYALRPKAALPIPNFMPVLKGVRHPRPESKTSEHRGNSKGKKNRGRRHA